MEKWILEMEDPGEPVVAEEKRIVSPTEESGVRCGCETKLQSPQPSKSIFSSNATVTFASQYDEFLDCAA